MVARRFLDPFASRPREERDGGKDANASCRVTRSSALSRSGPSRGGEVSLACWPPLPSAECSSCIAWRRGFTHRFFFLGCFCLIFYNARFSQRAWACIMPDLSVYVRVSSLYRPAKSKEDGTRWFLLYVAGVEFVAAHVTPDISWKAKVSRSRKRQSHHVTIYLFGFAEVD